MGAPNTATTSTYASGGAETSSIIPAPAGIVNNDVLLIQVFSAVANQSFTWPTGFTQFQSIGNGTSYTVGAAWKRANNESGSYTLGLGTSAEQSIVMGRISNATTTGSPIDTSGEQNNASSTNVTAPSITTSTANTLLVWFGGTLTGGLTNTWTAPSGFTKQATATAIDQGSCCWSDEPDATAGATGTEVGTCNHAAVNAGILTAILPIIANPPPKPPMRSARRRRPQRPKRRLKHWPFPFFSVGFFDWRLRRRFRKMRAFKSKRPKLAQFRNAGLLPGLPPSMCCTAVILEALQATDSTLESLSATCTITETLSARGAVYQC